MKIFGINISSRMLMGIFFLGALLLYVVFWLATYYFGNVQKPIAPNSNTIMMQHRGIDSLYNIQSKRTTDSQFTLILQEQNKLLEEQRMLEQKTDSFTKIKLPKYETKINQIAYYNDSALLAFYAERYGSR